MHYYLYVKIRVTFEVHDLDTSRLQIIKRAALKLKTSKAHMRRWIENNPSRKLILDYVPLLLRFEGKVKDVKRKWN